MRAEVRQDLRGYARGKPSGVPLTASSSCPSASISSHSGWCSISRSQAYTPERIHFLGARSDVPRLLRDIDVLLLTSHSEGCPNLVTRGACRRHARDSGAGRGYSAHHPCGGKRQRHLVWQGRGLRCRDRILALQVPAASTHGRVVPGARTYLRHRWHGGWNACRLEVALQPLCPCCPGIVTCRTTLTRWAREMTCQQPL